MKYHRYHHSSRWAFEIIRVGNDGISTEMEKAARRRELEEKLLAEREKELDKALAEEKGARELLLDLEKDR